MSESVPNRAHDSRRAPDYISHLKDAIQGNLGGLEQSSDYARTATSEEIASGAAEPGVRTYNMPTERTKGLRRINENAKQIAEAKQDAQEFGTKCGGTNESKCDSSVGLICDKHWNEVTKSYTALLKSKGLNKAGNRKGRKRR
jgi:hypothetical protein